MEFITLKDMTVATLQGHAIEFKANTPTYVPPQCWAAVQAAGAVSVDEIPEIIKPQSTIPEGAEREAKIIAAMKEIVLKNDRNSFTAAGAPGVASISTIVGFTVTGGERDQAWVKAQAGDD